jgi:hypothetical protein
MIYRNSLIKDLYNNGKGLTISAVHFHAGVASRTYTLKKHPHLINQCQETFRCLGWDEEQLKFESIEIDCLLRCYSPTQPPEFASPAEILMPDKQYRQTSAKCFAKKLSDTEINEPKEPNSYAIAEITSDSSHLDRKLTQLEKGLQVTLLRHRGLVSQDDVDIETIICLAIIVMPHAPQRKDEQDGLIHEAILARRETLPLLFRLYTLGRFARYYTGKDHKALFNQLCDQVSSTMSQAHKNSELLAHQKDSLDIQIKEEQLQREREARISARIQRMRQEQAFLREGLDFLNQREDIEEIERSKLRTQLNQKLLESMSAGWEHLSDDGE